MKRWSLKLKVSVYCTLLTVLGLVGTAAFILPIVYQRQLAELDDNLRDNAEELYHELESKPGTAASKWTRPVNSNSIPLSIRRRYIVIENSTGVETYRTKAPFFKELDLHPLGDEPFTVRIGDRNARFISARYGPLRIWIGTRLGTLETVQRELFSSFSIVIPSITGIVFLGAIFLARHSLRPVSAMTAAAERISAQSPDERLPTPDASDEIARLTHVLNESFDRLQRAYNSAARFSADASHQLKTPIAVLRAGLDEMRLCDYLQPEDRETVDTLLQQTRRLTTLVEDLLLLAQADAGRLKLDPTSLDLVPLIAAVVDDTEALGEEKELLVTRNVPERIYAKADPRRVKIILQNLTENAVKYNRQGGKIRITVQREGDWVAISVANTGNAIPEQYRDRLFERFNRAGMGENIKGHGLGLNIARELARAHGGDLNLARSDGEWTEFVLRLPRCETPVSSVIAPLPSVV